MNNLQNATKTSASSETVREVSNQSPQASNENIAGFMDIALVDEETGTRFYLGALTVWKEATDKSADVHKTQQQIVELLESGKWNPNDHNSVSIGYRENGAPKKEAKIR